MAITDLQRLNLNNWPTDRPSWKQRREAAIVDAAIAAFNNAGLAAAGVTVTIALAASATTDGMDITITVKDKDGATRAAAHQLEFWMSDAATGIGLTADAFSGDLTAAVGAILSAHTAKKHWSVITAATGIFTGVLVDSANPADVYVACKKPIGGAVVVSAISGVNWQGV